MKTHAGNNLLLQIVRVSSFLWAKYSWKHYKHLGCDREIIIYLRLNIKKLNPAYTLLAFTLTCYNNAQDDTEDEQFRETIESNRLFICA